MYKTTLILVLILSTVVLGLRTAEGATWYVEVGGSGTGEAWGNSLGSITQVNDSTVGGDTVYFGTGDWLASELEPISGNSATDKTVYTCSTYSIASAHLATIWSGDSVGDWILHSGSVWKSEWTPSATASGFIDANQDFPCIVGGDSIYAPRQNIASVTQAGYFHYDYANDTLYIFPYLGGDPDTSGHRILASGQHAVHYTNEEVRHTEIFGIDIKMGFLGAIRFSSNYKPDSNYVIHSNIAHANMAGWGSQNNSSVIYMGSYNSGDFAYGNVFQSDSIYSCTADIAIEGVTGAGSGATMYGMRQTVFDSCYFAQLPGGGVMWKGGPNDSAHYGNRVSFSTFNAADSMPYGRSAFTKAGVESCGGADRDSVYGCIFDGFYNALSGAVAIYQGDCDPVGTDYYGGEFIANNTFYNCDIFIATRAEPPVDDSTITIKYNVAYTVVDGSSRWLQDNAAKPILDSTKWCNIDSNYWGDDAEDFLYYDSETSSRAWGYWQGTMGYDVNGDTAGVTLTDPANGDYSWPSAPTISLTIGSFTFTNVGAVQNAVSTATKAPFLR